MQSAKPTLLLLLGFLQLTACSSSNDEFFKAATLIKAKNYSEGIPMLMHCAGSGHGGCMQALGSLYYRGEGVKQNYAQALFWEEHAYATGTRFGLAGMYAANAIATQYRDGKGIPPDYEKAQLWFTRAYVLCESPELGRFRRPDCNLFQEDSKKLAH